MTVTKVGVDLVLSISRDFAERIDMTIVGRAHPRDEASGPTARLSTASLPAP